MFQYSFMQHALIAMVLASFVAGVMGYLTLLRRSAFAAHGLGHISFTGAAFALFLQFSPMLGQFAATVFAGVLMGLFGQALQKRDLAIALVLSFMLGLGMLFLHYYTGSENTAVSLLFGDVLGVSNVEIHWMAEATLMIMLTLVFTLRPLAFSSIAPDWAKARGLKIAHWNILFMLLLALSVTLVNQIVGALLVFSLLIGPAAISLQLTRSFWLGIMLSVLIALSASLLALVLAFYTNWPVSVWLSTLVFMAYFLTILLRMK